MRKLILCTFILFNIIQVSGQTDKNLEDLDVLYQAIQKTHSYKDQVKGKDSYKKLYDSVKTTMTETNDLAVFRNLYRLIAPINDNHLGLYKVVDTTLKPSPLVLKLNKDSLILALKDRPLESVEGIYDSDGIKFAIFKETEKSFYVLHLKSGVVGGFIMITPQQSLDFISLLNGNRGYVLVRNAKHVAGNFTTINLYKNKKPVYNILSIGNSKFEYKKLAPTVDYLRLSSFSADNSNMAASQSFFERVTDSLSAPNLIVDVRNNGGGAFKTSQRYIDFINDFKGKVFILQNVKTGSNAEKFLIRLRNNKNVVTLGETTVGTITYGSNYGSTVKLPNHNFTFYPTDLKADSVDYPFESIGVKPKIILDAFTEDWIAQTLNYIKANSNE